MSAIKLDPYLFFKGECREAMEFYQSVFGGELQVQTYGDVPGAAPASGKESWVMHANLTGGDVTLMASDAEQASPEAKKIELSLGGDDEAKLRKIFEGLSAGGQVRSALKKEFWGDTFGTLTDKYGILWMVNITAKQ